MLPKKNRLKKDNDFKRLFRSSAAIRNSIFDIRHADNPMSRSRLAIIVGKKVSAKATVRNRLRRLISSATEKFFDKILKPKDVLIIVKPPIVGRTREEIKKNVEQSFKKAGLIG